MKCACNHSAIITPIKYSSFIPTNTPTSESHIITLTFIIILMNHRIRLRHSQVRHQHSRLHIHRLPVQLLVALLRVNMRKHVVVPIVANARNRNAKVGNLQKQQLRLLRDRIQVRRRQKRRTHRHDATPGKHVDHVHEEMIGHSEENIRFKQRTELRWLRYFVQNRAPIRPDLFLTSPRKSHSHFLLEERVHFVRVFDCGGGAVCFSFHFGM